eukprot:scaffold13637_cov112-Isochrysis_galbana.AAC.9
METLPFVTAQNSWRPGLSSCVPGVACWRGMPEPMLSGTVMRSSHPRVLSFSNTSAKAEKNRSLSAANSST